MPTSRWKAVEAAVAKLVDTTRKPITGRKGPDVEEGGIFALEIKHGKQVPKKPWQFFEQALWGKKQIKDPRIPAIAMHPAGGLIADTLICFRAGDYWDMIKLACDTYQSSDDVDNYLNSRDDND
jgi:hypothetical protein